MGRWLPGQLAARKNFCATGHLFARAIVDEAVILKTCTICDFGRIAVSWHATEPETRRKRQIRWLRDQGTKRAPPA
jgi:hypothetical protein